MLKLLRVDDRLLHGQVAFSWLAMTKASTIVIANHEYATNRMLKMTLSVGKPPGVNLKVLTIEEAIQYLTEPNRNLDKIMCIVQTVEDAYQLCASDVDVGEVCLGGVRDQAGKQLVHSQVYLSQKELELIKEIMGQGKRVFAQDVPNNKALEGNEIIEKMI